VVGDELADESVSLVDLHVEDSFIVDHFALDHLSMVDTDGQKYRVHNLSEPELDDLILPLYSYDADEDDPGHHIDCVSDNVVP
jgi:hypothetical protein